MPDYPSQYPGQPGQQPGQHAGEMRFDDTRPLYERGYVPPPRRPSSGGDARPWLFAVAGASLLGAIFAGVSTSDFVQHLDRQVHSIHCSIVPGAGATVGESGCRTVMMSPYSSLFRESLWGGIPISLLALAVFAYLVARAVSFALRDDVTRKETGYVFLATGLPALMSVIYGVLSATEVGALCTSCAAIYLSSALSLGFAFVAYRKSPPGHGDVVGPWATWFGVGVGYVVLLVVLYVGFAPSLPEPARGCGTLVKRDDPSGIVLSLSGERSEEPGGAPALAVVDPLCPACRAFDQRLEASGLLDELDLDAALFPLDSSCNWMVKRSLHPGACAVSEAMLCAKDDARAILDWAFEHQASLLEDAKDDDKKVRARLLEAFPQVKGCLGTPKARNRVNKSLRFAVANALPVLTPQLFIGDRRVCDEDTDLGLEFTVRRMIEAERMAPGRKR